MSAPQEKQTDQKRIVALLAEESQVPVADVAKLYDQEHAALAIGARITKFLHIFAVRNVREILRMRGIEGLAKLPAARPLLAPQRLLMPLRPTWSVAPAVNPSTYQPIDRAPLQDG